MDLAQISPNARQLLDRYPKAQPLFDYFNERLSNNQSDEFGISTFNFEAVLREYMNSSDNDPYTTQHLAAFRFLVRDLLVSSAEDVGASNGWITRYTSLVRRCVRWARIHSSKLCFVSFNYDYLLERACHVQFDFHAENFEDYVRYEPVSLLEPHGSVLWSWSRPEIGAVQTFNGTLDVETLVNRSIEAGERLTPQTHLIASSQRINAVLSDRQNSPLAGTNYIALLPAFALPVTGKGELVWPGEQEEFFTQSLTHGCFGRVALIGWRGAEEHFSPMLDRIIANGAKVLIGTGGDTESEARASATEVYENLKFVLHRTTRKEHLSGFARLPESLEPEWLLNEE